MSKSHNSSTLRSRSWLSWQRPRVLRLLEVLLATLVVALPAAAETVTVHLDPSATEMSFHLGATGHDVEGVLVLSSGEFQYDDETLKVEGELVVDATLASSDHKKRDKAMHKKVLQSVKFPAIRFQADHLDKSVDLNGASKVEIVGTMTIIGTDHPFTLPIEAVVSGGQFEATSTFEVPYIDWGLKNPSLLVLRVAKTVTVTIKTSGTIVVGDGSTGTGGGR